MNSFEIKDVALHLSEKSESKHFKVRVLIGLNKDTLAILRIIECTWKKWKWLRHSVSFREKLEPKSQPLFTWEKSFFVTLLSLKMKIFCESLNHCTLNHSKINTLHTFGGRALVHITWMVHKEMGWKFKEIWWKLKGSLQWKKNDRQNQIKEKMK